MEFIEKFTYLVNAIPCVVLIEYLTSYIITLGSCYAYVLRNGRVEELQASYAPFRTDLNMKVLYRVCFMLQVVFAAVSLLLNHFIRPLPAQVYALAILPTLLTIHIAMGSGKVEEEMVSGKELMELEVDLYTKLDLPLYLVHAALYLIGATQLATASF